MVEAVVMIASKHKDTAVFGRILAVTGRAKYGPLFRYLGGEGPKLALHFHSAVSVSTRLDQSLRLL